MNNTTENPTTVTSTISVISFGYEHGPAPRAERTEDVRDRLRDPARMGGLLDLDGTNHLVREAVITTPGALALVHDLAAYVAAMDPTKPRRIAIGCVGGKHRSVALADEVAGILISTGFDVDVEHRDAHRPRILRP